MKFVKFTRADFPGRTTHVRRKYISGVEPSTGGTLVVLTGNSTLVVQGSVDEILKQLR